MLLVRQRCVRQLLVLGRHRRRSAAGLQLGIVGGVESCNCSLMSDDQISDRSNPPPSACSMSSGTVQTGAVKPRWRCLRQIGPVYLVVVHILSYASVAHLRMTSTTRWHSRPELHLEPLPASCLLLVPPLVQQDQIVGSAPKIMRISCMIAKGHTYIRVLLIIRVDN